MAPTTASVACLCVLCQRSRRFRRDLCRSCYRKLSGEGLPLPIDRRTLRPRVPLAAWLVAFVHALPPDARTALDAALRAAGENEGR